MKDTLTATKMMKLRELQAAALELSSERGIPKEDVLQVIALALAAAYKKEYGDKDEKIEGTFDEKTDSFRLYSKKLVVDEEMLKNPEEAKEVGLESLSSFDKNRPVGIEKASEEESEEADALAQEQKEGDEDQGLVKFKPQRHILLREAKKLVKEAEIGDWILFPLEVKEDYGRIAAQTAKQVITQRLRELERTLAFNAIKDKEGQIVSGIIQRIEKGLIFVDLGKSTGTLAPQDQIAGERYQIGQRLKVFVSKVEFGARGPVVFLSRSSGDALLHMFEGEVPEIASGVVEIKAVAREAGSRSKIAVLSNDPDIDPIGSCVGQKGTRISIIIHEFSGEKIDIVLWSDDPATFIANALSPAKVLDVEIVSEEDRQAIVHVSPDQQSLAIGKKGQNARLAVKLTGWKIDVKLPEGHEPLEDEEKTGQEAKEDTAKEQEQDSPEVKE